MRLALGAGPWRIVSLLLAENMMLALIGAGLGVAIGVWGTRALARRAADHRPSDQLRDARRHGRSSVRCGARHPVRRDLRGGAGVPARATGSAARVPRGVGTERPQPLAQRAHGHRGRAGARRAVAAGLFLRSFRETHAIDPGFRREGVLLAAYDLTGRGTATTGSPEVRHADSWSGSASCHRIESVGDRDGSAARHPRSAVARVPGGGPVHAEVGSDRALANTVTPDYFGVMGIPLWQERRSRTIRHRTARHR